MAIKPDIQYVTFYTAGSAAQKIEHFPQKPKVALPKQRHRRVKRKIVAVDPIAVCGILVAVCMFFALVAGVREQREATAQAQQMSAYAEQLRRENEALESAYHDSYDIDEVYEVATAIGMIPREEAQHIAIEVQLPTEAEEAQPTFWENVSLFLTRLFA